MGSAPTLPRVRNHWPIPTVPPLGVDDVHIWLAALTQSRATLQEWRAVLSEEESMRAARFHQPEDRQHYRASHAILRFLLAAYTSKSPESLRFGREACGKPFLEEEGRPSEVCFNLSHSGTMALFGFTRNRRIGVDIEHIRPGLAVLEIARHAFSPVELEFLEAATKEQAVERFFTLWTRKEAFLKAQGWGLGWLGQITHTKGSPEPQERTTGMGDGDNALVSFHWQPIHGYMATAFATRETADVRFELFSFNEAAPLTPANESPGFSKA